MKKGILMVCTLLLLMLLVLAGKASADGECLGDCYRFDNCSGDVLQSGVNCSYCTGRGQLNAHWKPNASVNCFNTTTPSDLCLGYCPECCDGKDNGPDPDENIDYPDDLECTCGLDPSESEPQPPIPELSTILLFSVGLLALVGYFVLVRRKKKE